jgi:hypothetical protein
MEPNEDGSFSGERRELLKIAIEYLSTEAGGLGGLGHRSHSSRI